MGRENIFSLTPLLNFGYNIFNTILNNFICLVSYFQMNIHYNVYTFSSDQPQKMTVTVLEMLTAAADDNEYNSTADKNEFDFDNDIQRIGEILAEK